MRAPPLAVRAHDRCAAAEIHLRLVAGAAFHPPEGQRPTAFQAAAQSGGRCGTAGEAMLANQVLVDALRGETGGQLGLDDGPIRLAQAGLFRPGRRCLHADRRLAYFDISGTPR